MRTKADDPQGLWQFDERRCRRRLNLSRLPEGLLLHNLDA